MGFLRNLEPKPLLVNISYNIVESFRLVYEFSYKGEKKKFQSFSGKGPPFWSKLTKICFSPIYYNSYTNRQDDTEYNFSPKNAI